MISTSFNKKSMLKNMSELKNEESAPIVKKFTGWGSHTKDMNIGEKQENIEDDSKNSKKQEKIEDDSTLTSPENIQIFELVPNPKEMEKMVHQKRTNAFGELVDKSNRDDRLYKTRSCRNFEKGNCYRGDKCNFAHGKGELRVAKCVFDDGLNCCKFKNSKSKPCPFIHSGETIDDVNTRVQKLKGKKEFVVNKNINFTKKTCPEISYADKVNGGQVKKVSQTILERRDNGDLSIIPPIAKKELEKNVETKPVIIRCTSDLVGKIIENMSKSNILFEIEITN